MARQKPWETFKKALTRRPVILGSVVTVVVLAAVILGVMAFGPGSAKAPSTITVPSTTPAQSQSDQLAQQASQAAASGDATAAAELARRALELNPNNQQAKTLLEQAMQEQQANASQSSDSGSSGSKSGGNSSANQLPKQSSPDAGFMTAVSNITLLVPKSFSGYSMGLPAKSGPDVVIAATPSSDAALADRIIWAVHDRGSNASAKKFVTSVSKASYSVDGASVTVDGAPGYYGTDGVRFATVVYVRGRYVFEVLGTATGADPGTLHATVVKAAQAYPDAPPK